MERRSERLLRRRDSAQANEPPPGSWPAEEGVTTGAAHSTVTRLMTLAIKFQDLVDRGEVSDYAELARLGFVTRARLTQIMNLLLLSPQCAAGTGDYHKGNAGVNGRDNRAEVRAARQSSLANAEAAHGPT